ncbi:unnamed protein product [Dibothriocephalus latus]|uniref:Uncharacterized protein n=1 Tax=Dibothriocephalus latus TaxID=60516 RepID=A0A3P6QJV9_DIBLA|nr:unnamed protein product [Dibothriocephalus latus]
MKPLLTLLFLGILLQVTLAKEKMQEKEEEQADESKAVSAKEAKDGAVLPACARFAMQKTKRRGESKNTKSTRGESKDTRSNENKSQEGDSKANKSKNGESKENKSTDCESKEGESK